ncbi:hypothetical protein, partial [Azospirillum sp. OGB3]|uniref:hypothetical protein n=1 Tax=Azospirillum sp. OGB3 TaxID=2587012 RepID=UPI001B3BF426
IPDRAMRAAALTVARKILFFMMQSRASVASEANAPDLTAPLLDGRQESQASATPGLLLLLVHFYHNSNELPMRARR